ncbi:uncharacterized protein LOC120278798 isoform X2 [Dioscorea cayenensis subsp. rotundata]|uniref:Uncharacterized protein LOC120278798 isoform X2 n=1 Tax=Dioscorea cayennensis subsp. rotundata TaxID=55577 RepID=A0AB40CRP4_DIOCR|nr:uncharacterized protein LOC120278798 isoform X2 [Dioscorea cayenensis subsp. rotundata]
MDRWSGVVRISLNSTSSAVAPLFTIGASLLLSPSSSLQVPSVNAIFFNGDRVDRTGNPVIERLSDPQHIAQVLVSKLGTTANAWVIGASSFAGPFAVYKDLVPSVDRFGDPKCYDPSGFPALTSTAAILAKAAHEVETIISESQSRPRTSDIHVPLSPTSQPKTVLLGFSKGGIVINQILTELAHLTPESTGILSDKKESSIEAHHTTMDHICPTSKDSLFSSISEIHYVDVGLNSSGAYLNNQTTIKNALKRMLSYHSTVCFILHGTPRQWSDKNRRWIRKEKDILLQLLSTEANNSEGGLQVKEKLYFDAMPPSLQMHFEIIEKLDVS